MSTIKVFSLGGLDKKSNDLTRATEKASDMLNMEYDTQSTLKKRNGFEVFSTEDSKDMIYYNSKEEFLLFSETNTVTILDSTGATKQYNGASTYPLPAGIPALSNVSISSCENSNNLYFTNTDYNTYVMKYDGGNIYRAGLPTPRNSGTLEKDAYPVWSGLNMLSTAFSRVFYSYKDLNGNVTYSPYYQSSGFYQNLSISSFKNDANVFENGFFDKYCYVGSGADFVASISGTTMTVTFMSIGAPGRIRVGDEVVSTSGIIASGTKIVSIITGNGLVGTYTVSVSQTVVSTSIWTKPSDVSSASNTMIVTKHNYVPGDKFLVDTENIFIQIPPLLKDYTILDVELVVSSDSDLLAVSPPASPTVGYRVRIDVSLGNPTGAFVGHADQIATWNGSSWVFTTPSITFKSSSIGTDIIGFISPVGVSGPASVLYNYPFEYPVDVRCKIGVAFSQTEDTGYEVFSYYVIDNSSVLNNKTIATGSVPPYLLVREFLLSSSSAPIIPFEDVYDSTTLKIMPPICKYLASFGNQIVYGSIQSIFTSYDSNVLNAPNKRINYANDDFIVYSDVSTGDGPENISPLNIQKIGETWDGYISGMRRCNDSLIIFKNRGVFSIDGALISGEYQLRKINTNFAGCTSHKSILESDEGVYFQAHNGLYYTNGIGVKKLTYEIDSVFNSADYTSTKSVRLKKKQKSLFYVPELSKIVVIDYYYNQIYFWDNITATSGMVEDSLGNVYFSTGTNIYKFNDSYLDDTTAINATYATTWHHAGEPSLNKKFLSLRMFALSSDEFTSTVQTEGDWDTSKILTTNTLSFGPLDQTKFLMLDMQTKKSLRVTFSNNVKKETSPGVFVGENMVITGYELTFEMFNNVDKN